MTTILSIDLRGYKALPSGPALRIICEGATLDGVTDAAAALLALNSRKYDILLINGPSHEILAAAKKHHPGIITILITESPMPEYSQQLGNEEHLLVDHVIAGRSEESSVVHELRITIQKLLSKDIFGIAKYLRTDTQIFSFPVSGTHNREDYNRRIMNFVLDCKLGQHMAKSAYGVAEELLMNAIYDAPFASGLPYYAKFNRSQALTLRPEDEGVFSYGCDGRTLAISTSDPFGLLKRDTLMKYLKKVMRRQDSKALIDNKEGGAGLGFFKILYSSHVLVANVEEGKRTEIIALIDIVDQLRDFSKMARSIHYFDRH
jgi:hypothetical protein